MLSGMDNSDPYDERGVLDLAYVPIGERIAGVRAKKKWSQGRLAAYMRAQGSTAWRQNTVSRIETGKQDPSLQEIGHLVSALGTDVLRGTIEEMLLQQAGGWMKTKATEQAIQDLYDLSGQLNDKIHDLHRQLMAGDPDEH